METTTQLVFNQYQTGWKRLFAAIIDAIVLAAPLLAVVSNASTFKNYALINYAILFYPIIQVLYSVLGHYFYGQTLGKAVMNIKVIDINGNTTISLFQSCMRDCLWIIAILIGYVTFIMGTNRMISEDLANSVHNFVDSFTSYWIILELITMLFNKKRRAIHDFLAKTVVIKVSEDNKQ